MATTNSVSSCNSTSQYIGILCGDEEFKMPRRTPPDLHFRDPLLALPQAAVQISRLLPSCPGEPVLKQPVELLKSRRQRPFWYWDLHSQDRGAHGPGIVSANVALNPAARHLHQNGSMRMWRHQDAQTASPSSTTELFRCDYLESMHTNKQVSSVTPREEPPDSGLAAPLDAPFSSISGGTLMSSGSTQSEQGNHPSPYELYPKLPKMQLHSSSAHVPRRITRMVQSCARPTFSHRLPHATSAGPAPRVSKHYQCHYPRCEKKFTTSGHATRHFKIHTCAKEIPCTFLSCLKKFTRTDNMKQHLETHFKGSQHARTGRPAWVPPMACA
ncbi:transcriptional repressor [Pseudogymnoascus australis]